MRSERGAARLALFLIAAGGIALVFAAIALFGAGSQWWQRHTRQNRWPRAEAVVRLCKLDQRPGIRGSVQITYFATCEVTLEANGERVNGGLSSRPAYDEHRQASFGNPGVAELRAWIDDHRPGSRLAVHYDPAWPPSVELDNPPDIFDTYSPQLFFKTSGIAALTGVVLIVLGIVIGRATRRG